MILACQLQSRASSFIEAQEVAPTKARSGRSAHDCRGTPRFPNFRPSKRTYRGIREELPCEPDPLPRTLARQVQIHSTQRHSGTQPHRFRGHRFEASMDGHECELWENQS